MVEELRERGVRGESEKRGLFKKTWVVFSTQQRAAAERYDVISKETTANINVVLH